MKTKTTIHREPTLIYAERELRDQMPEQFFDTANTNNVVIDLSLTRFIDTNSLAALLQAKATIGEGGYKLTLVNPQASIRTLLYVTKIYHLVPSFSQHLQALAFLQKHSEQMQEQRS